MTLNNWSPRCYGRLLVITQLCRVAHCPAGLEHRIKLSTVNRALGPPKSRAGWLPSAQTGLIARIKHHTETMSPILYRCVV